MFLKFVQNHSTLEKRIIRSRDFCRILFLEVTSITVHKQLCLLILGESRNRKLYFALREQHPDCWYRKYCYECSHFFFEWIDEDGFRKHYCVKHLRSVRPDRWACGYFSFRFRGRRRSSWDLIAWQMTNTLWSMGRVVKVIVKKRPCLSCGREFGAQASNPKNVPLYCSDGCKQWSRHFRKRVEKNRRRSLANYIINRWKERVSFLL